MVTRLSCDSPPTDSRSGVFIHQSSLHPPHFKVIVDKEVIDITKVASCRGCPWSPPNCPPPPPGLQQPLPCHCSLLAPDQDPQQCHAGVSDTHTHTHTAHAPTAVFDTPSPSPSMQLSQRQPLCRQHPLDHLRLVVGVNRLDTPCPTVQTIKQHSHTLHWLCGAEAVNALLI